ncbi:MAG: O-antigen ligase family protein [Lentisphaerae bacterium]|jgi:O-antigen ligase|nr:O-antigen ligase family protein [Lentisphaerota bacterium]
MLETGEDRMSAAAEARSERTSSHGGEWRDLDLWFRVITLALLPAFVLCPVFKSKVFLIYAVLFGLQVWRCGYVRSGLEPWLLIGVLGLGASALDVRDAEVPTRVLQTARVLVLPLLMCQFRPIPRLERVLAAGFTLLGVYGLARFAWAPLVTGYAQDRPYCYADFFMHSSVIAVSGLLFFLVFFLFSERRGARLFYGLNILVFAGLVLLHQVRGSYLALLVVTPLLTGFACRRRALAGLAALLLAGVVVVGGLHVWRPACTRSVVERVQSMADRQDGSNRGRVVIWNRALEVFREHPVNGIGYRRFNREHVKLNNREFEWSFWHAHGEYISMLAETGVVGLAGWIVFKLGFLGVLWRYRRETLGMFLFWLFISFELHNLVETYHYERTAYIYIYLLLGLGLNQLTPKARLGRWAVQTEGAH